MGQQFNKVIKRRRRLSYIERRKNRTKTAASSTKAPAATKA